MSIARWAGAWVGALLVGASLAVSTYLIVWFGVGALVCGDGCEEAPLAVAMLAAVAALVALVIGVISALLAMRRRFPNSAK